MNELLLKTRIRGSLSSGISKAIQEHTSEVMRFSVSMAVDELTKVQVAFSDPDNKLLDGSWDNGVSCTMSQIHARKTHAYSIV